MPKAALPGVDFIGGELGPFPGTNFVYGNSLDKGLIRDPKGQGQVFEVTNKGFELAETLGASK